MRHPLNGSAGGHKDFGFCSFAIDESKIGSFRKVLSDILVLFRPNSKKYVDTIIEDVVSGIYPEFVVLKRSAERLKYTQLFLRATNKQYKACVLIYRDRKMFSYRV